MSEQTNVDRFLGMWREVTRKKMADLPNWSLSQEGGDGDAYRHIAGLYVIVSFSEESDGEVWLHLSASYRDRVPSHREMVDLRDLFIGTEVYAYEVFPPREYYVNIHPHCLHLWRRCSGDGRVLPEFSGFRSDIRSGGLRTI